MSDPEAAETTTPSEVSLVGGPVDEAAPAAPESEATPPPAPEAGPEADAEPAADAAPSQEEETAEPAAAEPAAADSAQQEQQQQPEQEEQQPEQKEEQQERKAEERPPVLRDAGTVSTDSIASLAAARVAAEHEAARPSLEAGADPEWRAHHDAWVAETLSHQMRVTVSEPQVTGRLVKKFTTYLVRSEPAGYLVRRRFRDFIWLQTALSARYTGLLVPPLPKKTLVGNKKESLVRARMRLLGLFMEQLTTIPYVRTDSSFLAFLSVQDTREWETAKRVTIEASHSNTLGENQWRAALMNYELPAGYERIVLDVKRQLEPLERQLAALAAVTRKMADSSRQYAADLGEFKESFTEWHALETTHGDPTRVEYANQSFPAMNRTMTQTSAMLGSWQGALEQQPGINELLLHDILHFENQQVGALKDMLRAREQTLATQQKALVALRKKEAEAETARAKNRNVAAKEKALADEQANAQHLSDVVHGMTKGIFFSELDKFNQTRERSLHDMVGMFAAAHQGYARRLGGVWQNYLTTLDGDTEKWTEAVGTVLHVAATGDGAEDDGD